jgi:hypothetical protein
VGLQNGLGREELIGHLIELGSGRRRMVVGFDFAFSLPRHWLEEQGWSGAPEMWRGLTLRRIADLLERCEPPFWGRPGRPRPRDGTEQYRRTDKEAARGAAGRPGFKPKSVFQIGGAGAVGTGSLRGIPFLAQLERAGFVIWPWKAEGWPRVVEIYPRLLTGKVRKSDRAARKAYLDEHFDLDPVLHERAVRSEDAFDAAVSVLRMAEHSDALLALPATGDEDYLYEGRIWWPGSGRRVAGGLEHLLEHHAEAGARLSI